MMAGSHGGCCGGGCGHGAATAPPAGTATTASGAASPGLLQEVASAVAKSSGVAPSAIVERTIPIDLNSPTFPDPASITNFEALLDFGESTAGLVRRVVGQGPKPEEP